MSWVSCGVQNYLVGQYHPRGGSRILRHGTLPCHRSRQCRSLSLSKKRDTHPEAPHDLPVVHSKKWISIKQQHCFCIDKVHQTSCTLVVWGWLLNGSRSVAFVVASPQSVQLRRNNSSFTISLAWWAQKHFANSLWGKLTVHCWDKEKMAEFVGIAAEFPLCQHIWICFQLILTQKSFVSKVHNLSAAQSQLFKKFSCGFWGKARLKWRGS